MENLKVEFDAARFYKKMELLISELIPYAIASLENFAELAVVYLQQTTPRSDVDRMHLADMWKYEKSWEEGMTKYVVYSMADDIGQQILRWLEFGTTAHVIPVSERCGFLHWISKESGDDVYTKKDVQHPGTQPYEMVDQTKVHIQDLMDAYIDQTIHSIVNKFDLGGK